MKGQDYINIGNEIANSFNYQDGVDFGGNYAERSFARTSNDKEARDLFEFLAGIDKKEFSLVNMSKNGKTMNLITTNHIDDTSDNYDIIQQYINLGWKMNRKSHNHPGGGKPSSNDKKNAAYYRGIFSNAKFDIFTKKGGYEYKY